MQAWYLGRSRDLWKNKDPEREVESQRLRQQVAGACRSRFDWSSKAETALQSCRSVLRDSLLRTRLSHRENVATSVRPGPLGRVLRYAAGRRRPAGKRDGSK